ncbi:hypothetical protein TL16_g08885 [Triparma laevis f. inornata]|uniref:Uncharacterized protein n=1 Tax=Triparma laevis f. inornata TaxID=1714386 RepID=A0A9W7EJI4_9STRA|nr:hypothetical protein TL16_g08885 [Triparma laevis f. inornata]
MATANSVATKFSDTILEEDHTTLLLSSSSNADSLKPAVAKLRRLILPLMFVPSLVSYLDCINLDFVADDMQVDLGLSDKVYSLGAGFFFVTYGSMQIPSNRLLRKFSGVEWLAFLTISWGLCTCCMSMITGEWSFYSVCTLLGFFEAGFFPGTMVYLRSFFTTDDFGWRAAALEGVALYFFQPQDVSSCNFLTNSDKRMVAREVGRVKEPPGEPNLKEVMSLPGLWHFTFHWLVFGLPYWGFIYWVPKIIDELEDGDVSSTTVIFLSSIPYTGAVIGNLTLATLADTFGNNSRFFFVGVAMELAGFGFFLGSISNSKTLSFVGLTITGAELWGSYGLLWSMIAQ